MMGIFTKGKKLKAFGLATVLAITANLAPAKAIHDQPIDVEKSAAAPTDQSSATFGAHDESASMHNRQFFQRLAPSAEGIGRDLEAAETSVDMF